ncbi:DNA replication factor C complex subunit Rfc1 [Dimargaris xerosporica]|nr:DNA replication factor C complex subunit Rfc1 [Dimargaris xerosporica]
MPERTAAQARSPSYKDTSVNIATAFAQAQFDRASLRPVQRSPPNRTDAASHQQASPNPFASKPPLGPRVWAAPKTPATTKTLSQAPRHRLSPSRTHQSVTFAAQPGLDENQHPDRLAKPGENWQTVWRDTPNWVLRAQERLDERPRKRGLDHPPASTTVAYQPNVGDIHRTASARVAMADPRPPSSVVESWDTLPRKPFGDENSLKDSFLEENPRQPPASGSVRHVFSDSPPDGSRFGPKEHESPTAHMMGSEWRDDADVSALEAVSPYIHSHLGTIRPTLSSQPLVNRYHPNLPEDHDVSDPESNAPTAVDGDDGNRTRPTPNIPRIVPAHLNPLRNTPAPRRSRLMTDMHSYGDVSYSNRFSDYYGPAFPHSGHYHLSQFVSDLRTTVHYQVHFVCHTVAWPLQRLASFSFYLWLYLFNRWLLGPIMATLGFGNYLAHKLAHAAGLSWLAVPLLPSQLRLLAQAIFWALLVFGGRYQTSSWDFSLVRLSQGVAHTSAQALERALGPHLNAEPSTVPPDGWSLGRHDEQEDFAREPNKWFANHPAAGNAGSDGGPWADILRSIQHRLAHVERYSQKWLNLEPKLRSSLDHLQQEVQQQQHQLDEQARRLEDSEVQWREALEQGNPNAAGSAETERGSAYFSSEASIDQKIAASLGRFYADGIARPDYALFAAGARVIPLLTSPTYEIDATRPKGVFHQLSTRLANALGLGVTTLNPPSVALDPDTSLGNCWPFRGSQGQLGIRLARPVLPAAFTVEHVSPEVALDVTSAPRHIEVWAVLDQRDMVVSDPAEAQLPSSEPSASDHGSWFLLTSFEYALDAEHPIQTTLMTAVTLNQLRQRVTQIRAVQVRILSNHGHSKYTCLYRFRVHGDAAGQQAQDTGPKGYQPW